MMLLKERFILPDRLDYQFLELLKIKKYIRLDSVDLLLTENIKENSIGKV